MAIDYSALLSDDQKRSILSARQQQFASEAFQHELNKATAEATGSEELVKQADEALAILEVALTVNAEELAKLPDVAAL